MAFFHHHLFEGCFLNTYPYYIYIRILHSSPPKKHTQNNRTEQQQNHTTPKIPFSDKTSPSQTTLHLPQTPTKKEIPSEIVGEGSGVSSRGMWVRSWTTSPTKHRGTKLYDCERLVVAVVTSLLLGLEGGNASMMEECQVTSRQERSRPLKWQRGPQLETTYGNCNVQLEIYKFISPVPKFQKNTSQKVVEVFTDPK